MEVLASDIRELSAEELKAGACEPCEFDFETTGDLPDLGEIIGQERAIRAVDFGVNIQREGYNIYVLGPTGTGRSTFVLSFLWQKARERKVPEDWCYLNNFIDPHRPQAIRLPPGMGRQLREDMDELIRHIRSEVQRAFEGEDYLERRNQINQQLQQYRDEEFKRLEQYARDKGFALIRGPAGFLIVPIRDGQPMSPDQFSQLDRETQERLERDREEIHKELQYTIENVRKREKLTRDELKALDQRVAAFAVEFLINDIKNRYSAFQPVVSYLSEVERDIINNVGMFHGAQEEQQPSLPFGMFQQERFFDRYKVNVMVDNAQLEYAPVVVEENPTYPNLIGRIEHRSEFGALVTNFSMIKPGALHRANGGYLVVRAEDILKNFMAWDALKRALETKQIKIEEPWAQMGLMSTVTLEPEPIPLDVKVVVIGSPWIYYLLYGLDEDFQNLFKVKADFDVQMDRTPENLHKYALFVRAQCSKEGLKHFDRTAIAKVVEYSCRLVENREKLSTRFTHIADVVREADYWASRAGHEVVTGEDVQQAIDEKVYRSNRIEQRTQELIREGTIMVETKGEAVGQVNGLSIVPLGDYVFGRPSRITARTFLGRAGVVNIEREAKLSGPIHDKGVLILSGYLGGKYAQDAPLTLSASICFEQSYEGVEGDSASSTELYALLSGISGIPIRQDIAVTGSVNQRGEIQPVGGVTRKIEGFFDICRANGLTGEQGVILPERNVRNLMLRDDVIQAVEEGKFHIYPVQTVDQGIEILTGRQAGERQPDGTYPEGTVNHAVQERLQEMAQRLAQFREGGPEEEGEEEEEE